MHLNLRIRIKTDTIITTVAGLRLPYILIGSPSTTIVWLWRSELYRTVYLHRAQEVNHTLMIMRSRPGSQSMGLSISRYRSRSHALCKEQGHTYYTTNYIAPPLTHLPINVTTPLTHPLLIAQVKLRRLKLSARATYY